MLARVLLPIVALAPAPQAVPAGTIHEDAFRSHALGGTVPFAVYTPPGYATSGKRYPVIYFLHGLPASPYAYRGIGFVASATPAPAPPAGTRSAPWLLVPLAAGSLIVLGAGIFLRLEGITTF